jgi:hypothetical protein
MQNVAINQITSEIEESLNNLPDEIRVECIMAIKNKRNQYFAMQTIRATVTTALIKIHPIMDK